MAREAARVALAALVLAATLARADDAATLRIAEPALAAWPVAAHEATLVAHVPRDGAHGPPRVVVLLHGWDSCAPGMALGGVVACGGRHTEGYGLGAEVDRSGRDALLLVPQLAMLARESGPGRFDDHRFRARWLGASLDAVAQTAGEPRVTRFRDAPVTLAAHSGGYQTLLVVLHDPGLRARVDSVVLFDALYAGTETLTRWAAEDARHRVVSIHGSGATTSRESARLVELSRAAGVPATESDDVAALHDARVVSLHSAAPHREMPQRHFADVLSALSP